MAGKELQFVTYEQRPDVHLWPIYQAMMGEPTLLHPTFPEIEQSYRRCMSVLMLDGDTPVGHVRFTPLLEGSLRRELGLKKGFPDIWEIGSAVIVNRPEYRGNGYYADLRNSLLARVAEEIASDRLLVLGTTKSWAVLRVLPKSSSLGIDFHVCHHGDFPLVAPFTCICEGDFGQGFQCRENCPVRVDDNLIPLSEKVRDLSVLDGGKIPCVMYVSSEHLAANMDADLRSAFGSQQSLIERLREAGYYG